jgi:hypothetical protein
MLLIDLLNIEFSPGERDKWDGATSHARYFDLCMDGCHLYNYCIDDLFCSSIRNLKRRKGMMFESSFLKYKP